MDSHKSQRQAVRASVLAVLWLGCVRVAIGAGEGSPVGSDGFRRVGPAFQSASAPLVWASMLSTVEEHGAMARNDFQESVSALTTMGTLGALARTMSPARTDPVATQILTSYELSQRASSCATTFLGSGGVDLCGYETTREDREAVRRLFGRWFDSFRISAETVREGRPHLSDIPVEDLVALYAYASEQTPLFTFKLTNRVLREGTAAQLAEIAPLVKATASALRRLPSVQSRVYRGIPDLTVVNAYVPNTVVTERAFVSASKIESVARSYARSGVLFVIDAKCLARDLLDISINEFEQEVVFPPGTRFQVLGREADRASRLQIIRLSEL